jgi:LAS superfamily LD-carboxypeptidase LdcB
MILGICVKPDGNDLKIVADAGYRYVETWLPNLYGGENKEKYENFLRALDKNKIRCEVGQFAFPGEYNPAGKQTEEALEKMAAAAKTSGLTLVVSSAYRSYQYQIGSFERWTGRLGLKEAERVSARAGHSQHQLGLVVDFGSLNNNFADSAMGKWVAANAARYGFSLSYPRGYEHISGYAWESWHYRYVGADLVGFINSWFDGIQQYALRFIHEWEKD